MLKTKVKRLASNLLDYHNDDADKEYNDAVENLIKFEADNNIGKKINADDDLEKAITDIFEKLDKYMGCKSFESINIDTIRFVINDFAKIRHLRDELGLEKDDELYEIEKKLRWLYSKMFNYSMIKINR